MRLVAALLAMLLAATTACKATSGVVLYGFVGGTLLTVGIVRNQTIEDDGELLGESFGQGIIAVCFIATGLGFLAGALLEGVIAAQKDAEKGGEGKACVHPDDDPDQAGVCQAHLICWKDVCIDTKRGTK